MDGLNVLILLFALIMTDSPPEDPGLCSFLLTVISVVIIIIFLPFSLFLCVKVSNQMEGQDMQEEDDDGSTIYDKDTNESRRAVRHIPSRSNNGPGRRTEQMERQNVWERKMRDLSFLFWCVS
jgi:hypothetical protein